MNRHIETADWYSSHLLEKLPAGAYACDAEGRITYFNPAAANIWGRTPRLHDAAEKYCGSFRLFTHDGIPVQAEAGCMALTLRDGESREDQHMIIERPDGTCAHVLGQAFAVRDEENNIIGAVSILSDISQRIQSELSGKENEERYKAIIQATPECVKLLAKDGTVLTINDAGLQVLEASFAEELVNSSVFDVIAPEYRDAFTEFHRKICQGSAGMMQFDIIGLQGTRRHMETHGVPLKSQDGGMLHLAVTRDITTRRRIEQKLGKKRETLESINRLSRAFASTLDLESLVQMITDEATALTGAAFGAFFYNSINEQGEVYSLYTLSGVPKESFSKFPHPRATPLFSTTFQGEGIVISDDITADPRYGRNAPYRGMPEGHLPVRSYLAVPVISRSGEVLGGLFLGHPDKGVFNQNAADLAEGIAAHAAIGIDNARLYEKVQHSEGRWRALAEAMPQLVWIDAPDGACSYLSQQWETYTGIPVKDMLGYAWLKTLHPDDVARVQEAWKAAVEDTADYNIEYRIRRYDGEYRWFKVRGVPMRDENGKIQIWYGTCTDIQELMDAKVRAESASVAKSEFLANMSHEIRTPMNAVVGLTSLLEMNTDPARQKEFLRTLKMSAQQLMALINDLLDIAKLEAEKIQLECVPFTLDEILGEVISINSLAAKEKGIELRLLSESCRPALSLLGDPLRFRQVLMNIVGNAVKFTTRGEVVLHVHCQTDESAKKAWVQINVKDTGIGISARQQETIFSKFSQADTSITRKYGGTGLGLSITKSLVELMGGEISVESEQGKGSEFSVKLPFALVDVLLRPEACESAEWSETSAGEKEQNKRQRILLVEDYEANILVATTILESFGYAYEIAHNGREALEKLGRQAFDLVLMDVQMPEMDGFMATQRIRDQERGGNKPPIPIIGMTAHALQGDREKCIAAGMDDYIPKPFQPYEVKEKIQQYLSVAA